MLKLLCLDEPTGGTARMPVLFASLLTLLGSIADNDADGAELPYPAASTLGLGVHAGVGSDEVLSALELGFRFLDCTTATPDVGEAVHRSTVPRAEIFVQAIAYQNPGAQAELLPQTALASLRTSYVDALLLPGPDLGSSTRSWHAAWAEMKALRTIGRARHLGVVGFGVAALTELLDGGMNSGAGDEPAASLAVVQGWMDPFHQDSAVRTLCATRGVLYQATASLGEQWRHLRALQNPDESPVLEHPLLKNIAREHNRSVALVVLRWQQQLGVSVIAPVSQSHEELRDMAAWLRPGGPVGWDSFMVSWLRCEGTHESCHCN